MASIVQAASRGSARERLLHAALRLSVQERSLSAVGLRELAREAGVHHTSFYRHFDSMDDLAQALAEPLSHDLRAQLREVRQGAGPALEDLIQTSVRRFFDYISEHPNGVVFCVREMHGPMASLRHTIREVVEDFRRDMEEDLRAADALPDLAEAGELTQLTKLVNDHALYAALDFIELPDERPAIVDRTVALIGWLISGARAGLTR